MPLGLNAHGSHNLRPPLQGIETPLLENFVVDQLDYILISNFYNLTCLPYLTEYCGFKGKIYATEPTVQLGRQLLLELSSQLLNTPLSASLPVSSTSRLDLDTYSHLDRYRQMYTEAEIEACFSKISSCSFDQRLPLLDGLTASAHSSGYCLGSSNWLIATEYERIVYAAQNVFSSGSVRFHAQPLRANVFANVDCVIMSQFAIPEMVDLDAHFGDLCSQIGQTLAVGGTVLLPVSNAGMILDLFAIFDTYLVQTGLNPNTAVGMTSAPQIPMYYVSSISEAVLAYANISAEWLDATKQERIYTPNNPFTHADLIETERLFRFDRLSQLSSTTSSNNITTSPISRAPAIIFCGHPSLRCGDIVPLVEALKTNPKNAIIFTDPYFDPKRAFAPFNSQQVQCKLHFCPLDSRTTYKAATDLVKRYAPRRLVVPSEEAKAALGTLPHNVEVIPMKHNSEIKIKLKRKYERGYITPELAAVLEPTKPMAEKTGVDTTLSIAAIRATLNHRDGTYLISPLQQSQQRYGSDNARQEVQTIDDSVKMEVDASHASSSMSNASSSKNSDTASGFQSKSKARRLFGTISPQDVLAELEELSIQQVEVVELSDSMVVLKLPQLEALLEMEGARTKIVTNKEESRKLLKEVIVRLLN